MATVVPDGQPCLVIKLPGHHMDARDRHPDVHSVDEDADLLVDLPVHDISCA